MTRCGAYKNVWIPGCMGAAAACGCRKSIGEIRSFCTCPPRGSVDWKEQLEKRIDALEAKVRELTDASPDSR